MEHPNKEAGINRAEHQRIVCTVDTPLKEDAFQGQGVRFSFKHFNSH